MYYIRHKTKDKGYFVSNRKRDGKLKLCCDDLYFFEELGKLKLLAKGEVKAITVDGNKEVLPRTKVTLFQLNDEGERLYQSSTLSREDGSYDLRLKPNTNYILRVEKEEFLAEEREISTKNIYQDKDLIHDIALETIKERKFIIENIEFDFNSYKLTTTAKSIIDKTVYQILLQNPTIIVEISAHSDSIGSKASNLSFSGKRAKQ